MARDTKGVNQSLRNKRRFDTAQTQYNGVTNNAVVPFVSTPSLRPMLHNYLNREIARLQTRSKTLKNTGARSLRKWRQVLKKTHAPETARSAIYALYTVYLFYDQHF